MTDLLEDLARASRSRVEAARERRSMVELVQTARERRPARGIELSPEGFDLIAEVKLASPSAGRLASAAGGAVAERALDYAAGGACAVSVLTEPERFGGTLEHLRRTAADSPVPVMRKDFLVDPYQVWEARAAGADGVLLIARILEERHLSGMLTTCETAAVFALVEAFDEADLARIGRVLAGRRVETQVLVGVNARDLRTLDVDLGQCERMSTGLPAGFPAVAESGLLEAGDARRVACAGYTLALVGTALMRSESPRESVRAFLAEGRAGRKEVACPSS